MAESEYLRGLTDALEIARDLIGCHLCGQIEAKCECPFELVIEAGPAPASQAQIVDAIASAIEARRAATAQTGAVHESAAPKGETPMTNPNTPDERAGMVERIKWALLAAADYPIEADVLARAAIAAMPDERKAMVRFMREAMDRGYATTGVVQCEHDRYYYEDCISCYDSHLEAALVAIERGDHLTALTQGSE